ncbi:MAG: cytochrome c oxidase subunit II [Calditrichaeota bacterium]|nr:MAG: cytochrome c oxidase subunit II [Calditrichota bacterium]
MLAGFSTFASQVDNAFLYVLIISLIFFVGIVFAMLYFVVRYHHKNHKQPEDIHGSVTLEVLWTIIPTILVITMFYYGYKGFHNMRTVPEDAMEVTVTGRMWSWMYTYDNGYQTDTLIVPVNQPVKLNLESADVLHSYYIPAFRVKQDAVPGWNNYLWFQATDPGVYDVMCAEYCGDRHSYMLSSVKAIEQDKFNQWYASLPVKPAETSEGGALDEAGLAKLGEQAYRLKGCMACHSVDGSRLVGPSFKGIFGEEVSVVAEGKEYTVTVDEDYLRRSMLEPNAEKVKGFEAIPMPPQVLTDEEINQLIAFIKSLK